MIKRNDKTALWEDGKLSEHVLELDLVKSKRDLVQSEQDLVRSEKDLVGARCKFFPLVFVIITFQEENLIRAMRGEPFEEKKRKENKFQ